MPNLLTLDRARAYSICVLLIALFLIVTATTQDPQRLYSDNDYPAFYNAGRIINEQPRGALYDRTLQERLYLELVPQAAGTNEIRLFSYTPFFALLFAPLARLPYLPSLILWALISVALFCVGFGLTWEASGLERKYRAQAFIVALAFLPFLVWCLLGAQTSAFGFAVLAGAIYLDRKDRFIGSGLVLSLMLYKPPLLILLVPMLVVTKRWRTLIGFTFGASVLGVISLAAIGVAGINSYLEMLSTFSKTKAAGIRPTALEVDAFSFFLSLTMSRATAWILFGLLAAIVLPFLIRTWLHDAWNSWSTAIAWTVSLNFYVLIYDVTLIIIPVLLMAGSLVRLPSGFKWLLVALFLVPWIHTTAIRSGGVQPLTIILIAFGSYLLWLLVRDRDSILRTQAVGSRVPMPR